MVLNRFKIPITYYGKDAFKELKSQKGQKALIVTDEQIYGLYGELIKKYLKKNQVMFFKEVLPDPVDEMVIRGGEVARTFKPNLILGFGGGSVMDTAKIIYYLYECENKTLYDCSYAKSIPLGKKSKLILIPTTSGTGAEHTPASVITNSNTGQKEIFADPELVPHNVILDPKLTLSIPPTIIKTTGIDAIAHAIEGLMAVSHSEFSDALNLHALKLLIQYLPLSIKDNENNFVAREKIHYAASMAGMACANSGCALTHSCGHALGATFNIQHGVAVGLMLPYIIEYNRTQCRELYNIILMNLNIEETNKPCSVLAKSIRTLLKDFDIPSSILELNIPLEQWNENLEKLIHFTKADTIKILNPRFVNDEDLHKIYDYAYKGKSVDF